MLLNPYKNLKDLCSIINATKFAVIVTEVFGKVNFHGWPWQEVCGLEMFPMCLQTWYITLSPADCKHSLALYFAGTGEKYKPSINTNDQGWHIISENPVASAWYFHFMVELFIKHVLGIESDHPGIFSDTSAYYGTVEQQGCLILHLHLLVWIQGSLSPDNIWKCLLDATPEPQQELIKYLESVHIGEFMTGTQDEILNRISEAKEKANYVNPTDTLPSPPPKPCKTKYKDCSDCRSLEDWWTYLHLL